MFEQKEKTQPQIHHVYMKKNHYLLKGLGALLLLPFLPTLALGYGAYKGSKWGWNKNKKATVGVWLGALMIIGVSGIGKQEVKPTAIEPAKQEVKVNTEDTTEEKYRKEFVRFVAAMNQFPEGKELDANWKRNLATREINVKSAMQYGCKDSLSRYKIYTQVAQTDCKFIQELK